MTLLPLILLALIQGLTEFLPVSSSGHLVIVHALFDSANSWEERLILDVAVHLGTLLAVLVYFRKDVLAMIMGLIDLLRGNLSQGTRLMLHVVLASIPVIAGGLLLHILKPSWLTAVTLMAWSTIIFGAVLWLADRSKIQPKTLENLTFKETLLIGLAQALALIPGTSRSGITMTAARFLGYSRTESAHFSLLLAIVAISGAGFIAMLELVQSGDVALGFDALLVAVISFVTGWASIAVMMKWLEKSSFTPFAIYRIVLGTGLLIAIYGGFWPGS